MRNLNDKIMIFLCNAVYKNFFIEFSLKKNKNNQPVSLQTTIYFLRKKIIYNGCCYITTMQGLVEKKINKKGKTCTHNLGYKTSPYTVLLSIVKSTRCEY